MSALGFVSRRHDIINGEYKFVPIQPEYKEYLIYMHKLFSEELLDKEYFTQDSAQLNAKVTEMTVGYTDAGVNGLIADEEDYQQYVIPQALTSTMNSEKMWPEASREGRGWGTFAMTDKCQYPEAAIRLIDFFMTQEGTRMVRCGPEYGKYEGIDGGWEIYTDEHGNKKNRLHFEGFDGFWNFRGQHTPLNAPYVSSDDITFIVIGDDPRNQFVAEKAHESGLLDVRRPPYPDIYFTVEESDTITNLEVDIENYVQEMDAKFITGERDINEYWDEYVENIRNMNIDEVIKIRQVAYDRWK